MIRLAGFLTGSAVAIGAMLLLLGMPELPSEDEPSEVVREVDATPDVELEPAPQAAQEEIPAPAPAAIDIPAVEPEPEAQQEPAATRWHAFWSPFGSRIAATGFVSRLEAVTGYDYRIVKVETGVFEVAFAYTDDAERDEKLSTIAAATGLELPDS